MRTDNPLKITLVSGLLASGKTSLIQHLLTHKPADQHWGLIINEFGEIGLDGPLLQSKDTPLIEVSGGCICCSAQANLDRALQQISQIPDLDHLIIEPTGLGHPAQIIDRIQQAHSARPLKLLNNFCLIDAKTFSPERYQKSAVLRDLIQLADWLVITRSDLVSADLLEQTLTFLRQQAISQPRISICPFGRIDPALIQQSYPRPAFILLQAQDVQQSPGLVTSPCRDLDLLPELIDCKVQTGKTLSIGWIFGPRALFKRPQLKAWLQNPPAGLLRAKGLIRTGKNWQRLSWSEGQLDLEEFAWRQDSRLEMLFDQPFDLSQLEKQLSQTLQVRDL